ncbi:MAG: EVE domain-containing protein [Rhizomicrobium sp.]|jgi:hypothetical protein
MTDTWIFQCNPNRFDIDGFLAARPGRTTWLVTRLGGQMKVGDDAFIWRSKGNDHAVGGIIAKAQIASGIFTGPDDPAAAPFWRSSADADEIRERVWLRIERVAGKRETLQRSWLAEDPILRDLQIIKMSNATNYAVDPPHAARLNALWEKAGKDWSYAETVAGLHAFARTYQHPVSKLPDSPVAEASLKIGRTIGSVYNKVMNFRSLDERDPRKGLDGASDSDRAVWAKFFDPSANALREDALDSETARLWPSGNDIAPLDESEAIDAAFERETRKLTSLTLAELQAGYARGSVRRTKGPRSRRSSTRTFDRDPFVVAVAKVRAGFRCEMPGCAHLSFIDQDGNNYCEVHHIHPLADGGPDTPENAACVCPSHHREAHHGKNAAVIRKTLETARLADQAQAPSSKARA